MFGREPVAIAAAIRSLILCAVSFGLQWTPEQIGATMLAVEAVLALVTRSQTTPLSDPRDRDGNVLR
jgi:hypothetical protein